MKSQAMNGGQALIKALEMEGVEVVFGLPGGCILPVYDPLIDSPIRHILVRHEQGAGHKAEGYADVTGRPGVALDNRGPATTHTAPARCGPGPRGAPRARWCGCAPAGRRRTDGGLAGLRRGVFAQLAGSLQLAQVNEKVGNGYQRADTPVDRAQGPDAGQNALGVAPGGA